MATRSSEREVQVLKKEVKRLQGMMQQFKEFHEGGGAGSGDERVPVAVRRLDVAPAVVVDVEITNIADPLTEGLFTVTSQTVEVDGTCTPSSAHLIAAVQYFDRTTMMSTGITPPVTGPDSSGNWSCRFNVPNNTYCLFTIVAGGAGSTDTKSRPFAAGSPE